MSDKIVTLPINMDHVECVTECWTYYKLIVLKTSPYYEDWIASHYSIYTTNQFNFRFGETWMYTPDYYDAILRSKPVHLFGMTESNIVDKLKAELSNGYYLTVVIRPNKDEDWYHEVIFYGYNDEEKVFYVIGRENYTFQKQTCSYKYMEDILQDLHDNFRKREQKGMEMSLQYQYPICAFKLRDDYSNDNCVFLAYRKLINELEGVCFQNGKKNTTWLFKVCSRVYRGISCLNGLVDMIHKIMAGEDMEPGCQGIVIAIQKLYEHRRMMIISMRYMLRKWEKAMKPRAAECISKYEECCNVVEKWGNMAIKYGLTKNEELLRRIIAEVPEVYEKEYNILNDFVNDCLDWEEFNNNYI